MSLGHLIDIVCPQCNANQKMQLWSSVNVTLDPQLKEELMGRRLNVFFCAHCDFSGAVDQSLLYHDMAGRYCIQYVTKEDMKSPEYYERITKEGTVILDPISAKAIASTGSNYLARPHFVFSMDEVALYAAFRDLCTGWGQEPPTPR